ncbi:hypothetical protein LEP48_03350 [Isoptericola sp. NEAU-Y5]|uniref:Co/Zn/Cd efflux system component n=1 Tax=Isoptericola luteus TaxID=2879484 RepID=A0ABS7ZBF1_9MICO|nr:hypothetical protein [Isoptericola sp. NEAU-Y5]MCA5892388.1 hypothetical protein [Isoptericola sp. NEAU-Y5]
MVAGVAVASVLAVAVAATGGVVWFLRSLDEPARPVRCAAALDGTDWYLSPVQAENAALIAGASIQRGLPARAATIALATALQESRLENIDYGDRDSVGLFQQRPSQGWGSVDEIMDPVYSTGKFYDGLVEVDGYEDLEVTVAAQAVQRSGFPDAYAQHETRSRAWASALTGASPGAITCSLPVPDPDDPAVGDGGSTADLAELLTRDLGLPGDVVALSDDGASAVVDATSLPYDDAGRSAWAVAHWAVATALTTGTTEVRVADQVWTRESASWTPAQEADDPSAGDQAVGEVTVHLGA